MKIKYILLIFSLLLSGVVAACSCKKISLQDEYRKVTTMIIGRVVGRKSVSFKLENGGIERYYKYRIRVKETYKGQSGKVITVLTPKIGSLCGVHYKVRGTYLISAVITEDGLFTNLCLRNISQKEGLFVQERAALKELLKNG
jgi:hypothetical protein